MNRKVAIVVVAIVFFIVSLPLLFAASFNELDFSLDNERIKDRVIGNYIDCDSYVDKENKNNIDLVKWANFAYLHHWGYVYGTYGTILTDSAFEAKVNQYPDEVGSHYDFIAKNYVGIRTSDCVGLIKGYLWFDPEKSIVSYVYGNAPDVSADGMYYAATEKGTIDTLPEIPGLAVWHHGHIGIYIGDGWVIQAANTKKGVIKTRVDAPGWNWTHWLKIPYLTYLDEEEVTNVESSSK